MSEPDPQLVFNVAKATWDQFEAEYWDFESDHRSFEPGVLIDGEPMADEWLAEIHRILAVAEELRER